MPITAELRASIEDLYDVFASYARVPSLLACGCCWSGGELDVDEHDFDFAAGTVRVLAPGDTRPLRELDANDLFEVAAHMPHLGGTVDAFKHYLPRLFEVSIDEGFELHTIADLVDRVGSVHGGCHWRMWPPVEQRAVRRFLETLWREFLTQKPGSWDDVCTYDLVIALVVAADDITDYLNAWTALLANPIFSAASAEHLNELHEDFVDERLIRDRKFDSAFEKRNFRRLSRWRQQILGIEAVTTALERAVTEGDTDAVSVLLRSGTDPSERDPILDEPCWQIAFEAGKHDIVKLFFDAGAVPDVVNDEPFIQWVVNNHASQLSGALGLGFDPNVVDVRGRTALHHAILCKYIDAVRLLLDRNVDQTIRDGRGMTALDLAQRLERTEIVALLNSR